MTPHGKKRDRTEAAPSPKRTPAAATKQLRGSRKRMISATLSGEVLRNIEDRSPDRMRSAVIERDLARYYSLLSHTEFDIAFTLEELSSLCDIYDSILHNQPVPLSISDPVAVAFESFNYADQWGVDAAGLVAKLRRLDGVRTLCLLDAIERGRIRAAGRAKNRTQFSQMSARYALQELRRSKRDRR